MKVRDMVILALACAADLTNYDGYGVIADAALPGSDIAPPGVKLATAIADDVVGVITTPADGSTGEEVSVATAGFGGTVRFKLGGTVAFGDKLTLMADGTFEANGAGTVVGKAAEAGVADELIEGWFI